jgi:hypothetical protein
MTQAFGDSAVRCCTLSAQTLGWRPAEFWSATPAELATALRPPDELAASSPPSRETIARMMERDSHD